MAWGDQPGGCGSSYGLGGGCGGGYDDRGYRCSRFGSTEKNERMRLINDKAHATCKKYDWNHGNNAHTTDAYELSSKSGYSITFALQTKMNALLDEDRRRSLQRR